MLLYRKSRLWGCYKPRHVTKRDVLVLATLRYLCTMYLFLQLKCCGTTMNKTDDYISWEKNITATSATNFPTSDGYRVPKSCCARFESDQVTVCQKSPFDTKFNVTGCFDKLDQTFQDNKSTFFIAGIVMMVIMVSTY